MEKKYTTGFNISKTGIIKRKKTLGGLHHHYYRSSS
jgi:hypothetical protein